MSVMVMKRDSLSKPLSNELRVLFKSGAAHFVPPSVSGGEVTSREPMETPRPADIDDFRRSCLFPSETEPSSPSSRVLCAVENRRHDLN
jgi:hypothetical protein